MIAGAAVFLTLLPLAAAPVIFHLLMRRKRRNYVFSTSMFFHKIDPRMRSRRRIQELLLLLARILLITLALLALSRLSIDTVGDVFGFGERQVVVLVIDNSGSMNTKMPDGKSTKLQTAKEGAQVLLSHLDGDAEAAVLTLVDDPNVRTSLDMKAGKPRLAETIGRITGTEATGRPAVALGRAVSLLKSASTTGAGSVHVFSDLQSTEWGKGGLDKLRDAGNVRFFFHQVPSAPVKSNVSLLGARLSGRRVLPKQPNTVFVELRNNGESPAVVRLNSQDDQRKQTTDSVQVPPKGRAVAEIMIQPESQGNHWVRIWIEGDGYAYDNQTVLAYLCGSTSRFFLVGDDDAGFGRLPLALSPYGDGRFTSLVSEVVSPDKLEERGRTDTPALVVMSWSDAARVQGGWLEEYVKGGGNLLLVPPARKAMRAVRAPAWIDAELTGRVTPPKQVRLNVLSKSSDLWDRLREPGGGVNLIGTFCKQYHPVLLPKDSRTVPLLGTGKQETVLALAKRGKGRVFCSGIAFSSEWTLLYRMQEFVVLAQSMALSSGLAGAKDSLSLVAGETLEFIPGREEPIRVVSLVGDPMDWSGPRDQFPRFVRSGGYVMQIGGKSYGLSVRGAVEEGLGEFVSGTTEYQVGGVGHPIVPLEDERELKSLLAVSRTGVELYLPFLLLAIAAMVAEGILGSPRPLKMKNAVAKGSEAAS